ncbi:MFS transporter [Paraferrimonas sp. SM1919]|uniref:MFS transporter n=1 Tax=Paraferrimonas sp. SM1919 TaxID=2662263 RepID=UPI0013D53EBB|nr:MFS transporter [Paraferrimonas sp. SM1919]
MEQALKEPLMAKFQVEGSSIWANVFLAFLTTAGLFYVNIMPALVSGLIEGLAFTKQQAGQVSSANLYGASFGALLAVFLVKKINWRSWSFVLLSGILIIDFISSLVTNAEVMIALRALHGLVGGLSVGIGFAVIARTADPDKAFGYLLFIQWGLGGLGLMVLPPLVPEYGSSVLFYSLMIFTLVALVMLCFLPDYPPKQSVKLEGKTALKPLLFAIAAIFLFQAANMGLFAYMIELGKAEGLSREFMSPALAAASWIALIGAFLVIVIGTKFGRLLPLILGIVVTAICSWALHFSELEWVYLVPNVIIGITWALVLPFLFGLCSELDKAGNLTALGGFASKMGLASGPLVASMLLGDGHYGLIINVAVVGLLLCALVAVYPARLLDRQ